MTRTTNRRGNAAPGRARGPDFPRPDKAGFPLNFRTAARDRAELDGDITVNDYHSRRE